MFDNGDLLTSDSTLVKNLNNEDGFFWNNYFKSANKYDKEPLICSSNIVGSKYNRLTIANVIGPDRTNISLDLMTYRFFILIHGRAPFGQNYSLLTSYEGNDFTGSCIREGRVIHFNGLVEEIWSKYGKKVYYLKKNNKFYVDITSSSKNFYINKDGYFDNVKDIRFNVLTHSSGGVALRMYFKICKENNVFHYVNSIINLSVPHKGSRMVYALKNAFQELMKDAVNNFYKNIENGFVKVIVNDKEYGFSYKDLQKITRIDMLASNSFSSNFMRDFIGYYILYFIPFDGKKRVLGNDPALYDLHPDHYFIRTLNKVEIPEDIPIVNFIVRSAYAPMFKAIGKYLRLGENDGVVDVRDNDLSHIPNYNKLKIKNYYVENSNHIPMPYIKPVFEMKETIDKNYGVLKILLKKNVSKEEGVIIIYLLFTAIMKEFGLELNKLMKEENYSVIDYFAENPVLFE